MVDSNVTCEGRPLELFGSLQSIRPATCPLCITVSTQPIGRGGASSTNVLRLFGAGKTDTWRESKSLLGKELIQHGWPVSGLDAVTDSWIRAIGTNHIFTLLRTPNPERRWVVLTEAAAKHQLATQAEDPVKLRAVAAIQRAMRKGRIAKMNAKDYRISADFFVNDQRQPVQVLESTHGCKVSSY